MIKTENCLPKCLIWVFKKLESPSEVFDVPDRFCDRLQSEGWIEFASWDEKLTNGLTGIGALSGYVLTDAGKEEFEQWRKSNDNPL